MAWEPSSYIKKENTSPLTVSIFSWGLNLCSGFWLFSLFQTSWHKNKIGNRQSKLWSSNSAKNPIKLTQFMFPCFCFNCFGIEVRKFWNRRFKPSAASTFKIHDVINLCTAEILQKVISGNVCRILYMNCVYNDQLNSDCCWFESWCIDFWRWLIRLLIIVFTWRLITMGTPIWRAKQVFLLLQSQQAQLCDAVAVMLLWSVFHQECFRSVLRSRF